MTPDAFVVAAILFDLDNTLFDRDLAVRYWAEVFARARLGLRDDAHADAVDIVLALDAHGYGAKPPMFAVLKGQYPVLSESIADLVDDFYRQVPGYASLDERARIACSIG